MAKIKAVAYARYSSDRQQESSITVQLAAIRKFCTENKIELIREYIDEEQTGTNANRRQFQQMMKDAPEREFQLVVVHRMDRWARNVDDARYYKKLLSRYGIKMVSAIETFDETPEGEFFELLSMGMAELYSKKLARKATAGKLANAKLGRIHGGTPLLGYKVKGKYYVIEEQEAKAVRIIFDMTLKGCGYATIRDYLNENGYRHADGRAFSSAFNDILRNRKYIGEYVYNRLAYRARGTTYNSHKTREESEIIRIPNGMPRIIDDETFQAVQAILDSRQRKHHSPKKKAYLLTGVLRCAECGNVYCGSHQMRHGVYNSYYKCNLKTHRCKSKCIIAEYLDEYVLRLLKECLLAPKNHRELCDFVEACYIVSYDKAMEELERVKIKQQETEERRKAFLRSLTDTERSSLPKFVLDEVEEFSKQQADLVFKRQQIEERLEYFPSFSLATIKRKAKSILALLQTEDIREQQRAIAQLISVIYVGNDKLETVFNFQVLLNGYQPIQGSVAEVRDSIAIREQHGKRIFTFSKLQATVYAKNKEI